MVTFVPVRVSAAPRRSLLEYWHLLSLDAPTIAALWSYTFLRSAHLASAPADSLLLGAATWVVYVADRVLDGVRPQPRVNLRERHLFHARHRTAFLAIVAIAVVVTAWWVAARMSAETRRDNLLLALAVAGYFVLVHVDLVRANLLKFNMTCRKPWFPKEFVVGAIFAAGVAVPAWSRAAGHRSSMLPAILLFAGLCWLNCAAIDGWERPERWGRSERFAPRSSQWTLLPLRVAAIMLATLSLLAALFGVDRFVGLRWQWPPYMPIYGAVSLSASALLALDYCRGRFSAIQLRIAADAALLTPLVVLPFLSR